MKLGKTLQELAAEVQRQADAKRDFLASTADIKIVASDDLRRFMPDITKSAGEIAVETYTPGVVLELGGKSGEVFAIGDTAHDQIAGQANIPLAYYRRMLQEQPQLLAHNVNTWFAERAETRMLRTLDGKARALLSDKYRPLDNDSLLEVALPALDSAGLQIVSCEITEKRLYVKAVDESIQRFIPGGRRMGDGSHIGFQVPSGEIVPAVQFGNSEIGFRTLEVVGGSLDRGCTNLMWAFKERGIKRRHIGAHLELGDELYKLLTTEAREATDKAVWLQFRDAIKSAISVEGFDDLVETLKEAAGEKIKGDVEKVVEITVKKFSLGEGARSSVLRHLIEGGDLSKFGLANAVTSAANDLDDYENATSFEGVGGKIVELSKHEWKTLAAA